MSSIKRDVKKKSSASTGVGICFSRSSPLSICLAGAVLHLHSPKFLLVQVMTPSSLRERQAIVVECVNHGSIRGSWPMTISGYPKGHNVQWVTRYQGTQGQISLTDTPLEPSISRTRPTTTEKNSQRWKGLFLSDAQTACRLNCCGSKLTPFFHMVKVMAAIFRARVSRAMVGRIPLAMRAT
jgi:hypothetical protein